MQLLKSDLEKIEKKYGYLVDKTLDFELKIGKAREILDVIYNHLKGDPEIKKAFTNELKAQEKLFEEMKKNKIRPPYENKIKDSTQGWLNFFVLKGYIPERYKSSFSSIYTVTSESLHARDIMEQQIFGIVAKLNEIIKWLFKENEYPIDFLKEVKLSDETDKDPEINFKPKLKKPQYIIIASVLLICVIGLLYFFKFYNPTKEFENDSPISELKKEKMDSIEQKQDSTIVYQESIKKKTNNLKPMSSEEKTDENLNNNKYILIKAETDSENLDPALLNIITEKYKNQYQFIMGSASSLNSADFEFRTNFKTDYKASQYSEGIISCKISFSYQIINNSNQSILENHFSEASGIGFDKSSAKQKAIQKLKI